MGEPKSTGKGLPSDLQRTTESEGSREVRRLLGSGNPRIAQLSRLRKNGQPGKHNHNVAISQYSQKIMLNLRLFQRKLLTADEP